jgi:hypothetical protein
MVKFRGRRTIPRWSDTNSDSPSDLLPGEVVTSLPARTVYVGVEDGEAIALTEVAGQLADLATKEELEGAIGAIQSAIDGLDGIFASDSQLAGVSARASLARDLMYDPSYIFWEATKQSLYAEMLAIDPGLSTNLNQLVSLNRGSTLEDYFGGLAYDLQQDCNLRPDTDFGRFGGSFGFCRYYASIFAFWKNYGSVAKAMFSIENTIRSVGQLDRAILFGANNSNTFKDSRETGRCHSKPLPVSVPQGDSNHTLDLSFLLDSVIGNGLRLIGLDCIVNYPGWYDGSASAFRSQFGGETVMASLRVDSGRSGPGTFNRVAGGSTGQGRQIFSMSTSFVGGANTPWMFALDGSFTEQQQNSLTLVPWDSSGLFLKLDFQNMPAAINMMLRAVFVYRR